MKKIKLDMDGRIIAYLLWAIVVHESVVVSLVVDLILDSRMKIHTNLNIFFEKNTNSRWNHNNSLHNFNILTVKRTANSDLE